MSSKNDLKIVRNSGCYLRGDFYIAITDLFRQDEQEFRVYTGSEKEIINDYNNDVFWKNQNMKVTASQGEDDLEEIPKIKELWELEDMGFGIHDDHEDSVVTIGPQ